MSMEQERDFKVATRTYQTDKSQTIRNMWVQIAKRPSEFDLEVIKALRASIVSSNEKSLGYNASRYISIPEECDNYGCYGDKLYTTIRTKLVKIRTSSSKKINLLANCPELESSVEEAEVTEDNHHGKHNSKKKEAAPSKTEIILQRATMDKLNERLDKILGALNFDLYIQPGEAILKSDILEIRAIGFMYMTWHMLAKSTENMGSDNLLFPYSVIVTLQRFIGICSSYVGYNVANPRCTMPFSSLMITDLQFLESQLIKAYQFNGVNLYSKASELILGSTLDVYLPKKSRTAFPHQLRVAETLLNKDMLKSGFIMFYRTMTNSGKTSSIITLAAVVELLRKKFPTVFGDLQVIATCDVHPVLTRWGQLLYHAGYPFGIASKRHIPSNSDAAAKVLYKARTEVAEDQDCVDTDMRFSNSDTCKSIKDRLVIVCAPDIALKIITHAHNASNRFILLHDEPTMYAETAESPGLKVNMAIMCNAPKWAIFSSATLPYDKEKTRVFSENHKKWFSDSVFIDNTSSEIYSCCNMRSYDGKIITPHLGIKTKVELATAIEHINNNPFLGKLYTPLSTRELYERACTVGQDNKAFVAKVPRIMKIFNNVENLFPDKIRLVTLDILKAMLELADKEIEEICNGEQFEYESDSEDSEANSEEEEVTELSYKDKSPSKEDDITFATAKLSPVVPKDINFANLGTTEAYRFPYLNLIASDTPDSFMRTNYLGLLEDVKKKITSLGRLQTEYENRLNAWRTGKDALEKKIKNADGLSKKLSEHEDSRPFLVYPDECQINTRTHINKYAKHSLQNAVAGKFRQGGINLRTETLDELHVTEDTKLALLSGVCFYGNPDTLQEDEDYLATALELTSMRNVESLIADSSICYGTDYPIGGVVITPEFASAHSLNTIYQLMSRAGRGRKSINADIYVSKDCSELILETVRTGSKHVNQETENMIKAFRALRILNVQRCNINNNEQLKPSVII